MCLLIKHLLSTAWVPARPEGPEHSDCGVQYTEAGQTWSGPGTGRWWPQAGSIPARPPLSLPGLPLGLPGANGRLWGQGPPPLLWGSCRADACRKAHPREGLQVPVCP